MHLYATFLYHCKALGNVISLILIIRINCSANQARSQDQFWGGAELPKVDLLDLKSALLEPHPLNPPTKT